MKSRLLTIFLVLLVASLVLGACGPTQQTEQENPPLLIGWSLYPGWYPLILAQELGLYEKYGVEVELVRYETYDDTAPQLASGLVDGAALVLGDVLLEDVGQNVSVVLVTDHSNGADQLIASPAIMESQDLRGARIGVLTGTFGELLVRAMLDQYGVKLSEVELVAVPPEQVALAIPGSIDIGHTFEPFASEARTRGNGNFFDSSQARGIVVDTIAFRHDVLQNRPEDVRNFINAWFDAVAYWQSNPSSGNALIADATGQNVNDVSAEGILFFDRAANLATFQPGADTSSLFFTAQFALDVLIESGIVTRPVEINDVLNPSYLE